MTEPHNNKIKISTTSSTDESIKLLQEYLQINTVNPPGDTREACRFFAAIFDKEGIPYQILGAEDLKPCILAKIEGTGEEKPVILLNHLDTVTFDTNKWTVPPLDGIIKDEKLYGRGAIDMKCVGIFQLMAFLSIARKRVKPMRTICFLATSDEEIGGELGAAWIIEELPELLEAEAVLNEGYPLIKNSAGVLDHICIDVSEKVMFTVKLSAEGTPGHASVPTPDNPNVRIVKAAHRLLNWNPPRKLPSSVQRYFRALADIVDDHLSEKYHNMEKSLEDWEFAEKHGDNLRLNAVTSNTISLTVLKGGDIDSTNVIPPKSEAVFDIRLLPGVDKAEFLQQIRSVINDDGISISMLNESESTPVSSVDSAVYKAIEEVYADEFPGIPTAPYMVTFVTDSRFFRKHGIDCYGFQPMIMDEKEYRGMHGNDEFISLENIQLGSRLTENLLKRLSYDKSQ